MNLYDGCESNNEIIYGFTSLDFYDKLEKRQNEILSQGKKVVFVESNTSVHSGARVVIYSDKIPEIMQNYKYRYVKSMENGQEIVFLDIVIAVENIENLFVWVTKAIHVKIAVR